MRCICVLYVFFLLLFCSIIQYLKYVWSWEMVQYLLVLSQVWKTFESLKFCRVSLVLSVAATESCVTDRIISCYSRSKVILQAEQMYPVICYLTKSVGVNLLIHIIELSLCQTDSGYQHRKPDRTQRDVSFCLINRSTLPSWLNCTVSVCSF